MKGPFPGGAQVLLETFRGEEALGRPYRYSVRLISHDPLLDSNDVLGKPLSVGIKLETGSQRFFHGIVSSFAKIGASTRYTHYEATLQPLLGVLEHTLECRIFKTPSQTALDIVTSVLDDCHITDLDATALGDHTYLAREYCLQYRESGFHFVQRLLEEEGIYYFFTHSENKHMLVLADAASVHKTVPGYESVLYAAKEEKLAEEHFWALRVRRRMYPGRHTVLAGYQPTELRSKQPQFGRATSEDLVAGYEFEHYDYPGGLFVPNEAEHEAKLWTEERAADNTVVEVEGNTMGLGVGDLLSLRPGFSGAVAGVPFWTADDFAKQYLVVRATYSISIDQYETGNAKQADQPFRARYWLLDAKKPFRTPRLTKKPLMRGPQTALVVGPDHEEIWTDQFGRVCVQFDWDRQGKHDELSSCWMRVSSGFAGGKWGEVHIPRIGHEVLVRFLDGDPDRPIIAGELYSADNMPPYALPAHKTQSGTKSRSSKKGTESNFNEIRFEDLKGQEELHIQAERDMATLVKDSQTLEVGHDRKIDVGHDEKNHVTEERELTVGADDKVTVLGNHDKTVIESVSQNYRGNHTRHVHGDQKLTAMKNKDEHVGLVHKLTTDKKFQLNQSTTHMTFESTDATVASAAREIVAFAGGATFSIDQTGLIELDSPIGVKLTCGPSSLAITAGGVALAAPSVTASAGAGAGATMGLGDAGISMNGKKVIIEADGVCKIYGKKKIKLQESEGKKGRKTRNDRKNASDAEQEASGPTMQSRGSKGGSTDREQKGANPQRGTLTIVASNLAGRAQAGLSFHVIKPDGGPEKGKLDENGRATVKSTKPGSFEVTFPDLDGADWEGPGVLPLPPSGGRTEISQWVVQRGDRIETIARDHGFANWETVWTFKGNERLRNLRDDPNRVQPGDVVAIPTRLRRSAEVSAGLAAYVIQSQGDHWVFDLWVRLDINPNSVSDRDDIFCLTSTDGEVSITRTIVNDKILNDESIDLLFERIDGERSYSLKVIRNNDDYWVFQEKSGWDLHHMHDEDVPLGTQEDVDADV